MTFRHGVASLAVVLKIAAAGIALSGSSGVTADEGPEIPGAVCMASPSRGGEFRFPVPVARESEMAGRGFEAVPCGNTLTDVASLNTQVCAMAATAPQAAKDGFATAYGISPDELCNITSEILQAE